jgi:hypothetical protein
MIKNKKAMILILLLSIFTVFILMPSVYVKLDSSRAVFEAKAGTEQFSILNTIDENEAKLFYIDQSAKYSFFQVLKKLEDQGGFSDMFPCGQLKGYAFWQNDENTCFPTTEDVSYNVQSLLTKHLNPYLKKNNIPENNYDFYIKPEKDKTRLIGTALKNLKSNLMLNNEIIGKYSIKPSFDMEINYNILIYEKLSLILSDILDKITECESKNILSTCVNEKLAEHNQKSNIALENDCDNIDNQDDRIFFICAKNNAKYFLPDSNFEETQQKIKFALYIRKPDIKEVSLDFYHTVDPNQCIILSWQKPQIQNLDHYNLYYSEQNIDKTSSKKIEIFPELADNGYTYGYFDPVCAFEGSVCLHKAGNSQTDTQTTRSFYERDLFFSTSDNKYFYKICNINNNNILISAVDKTKDETDLIEDMITTKDKLAPGKVDFSLTYSEQNINIVVNNVAKNADNSDFSNDLDNYLIFLQKDNNNDIVNFQNLKAQDSKSQFSIAVPQAASGEVYYIGIIAKDRNNNPLKKVAATAEKEGHLEIGTEYTKIINELANPQSITIP